MEEAQHLDEFNKTTTDSACLEVKIKEEDKVLLLLASLPSSFHSIVTTLLFGKEMSRLDEVVVTLLMNEIRWGNNGLSYHVKWPWLQMSLVRDKDDQERRRNGPNIQDQVIESSNAITTRRKVI